MAWRPPCYSHRKMFAGSGPSRPPPGAVGRAKVEASASSPAPGSLHIGMPHRHHTTVGPAILSSLLLLFRDPWYLSTVVHLCLVPMERTGVQLGAGGTSPLFSIPNLVPPNKGCLSKEKGRQPPQPGASSRWPRNAEGAYPRFCLSHFCFY